MLISKPRIHFVARSTYVISLVYLYQTGFLVSVSFITNVTMITKYVNGSLSFVFTLNA